MDQVIMEAGVSVNQRALPDAVPAIRAAVSRFLEPLDLPRVRFTDILLVVTEASSNVVRHAYPGTQGDLRVEAGVVADQLWVRVSDWGCGWGKPSANAGLGLGVPLMHTLADRVHRSRRSGANVVELRFNVVPADRPTGAGSNTAVLP